MEGRWAGRGQSAGLPCLSPIPELWPGRSGEPGGRPRETGVDGEGAGVGPECRQGAEWLGICQRWGSASCGCWGDGQRGWSTGPREARRSRWAGHRVPSAEQNPPARPGPLRPATSPSWPRLQTYCEAGRPRPRPRPSLTCGLCPRFLGGLPPRQLHSPRKPQADLLQCLGQKTDQTSPRPPSANRAPDWAVTGQHQVDIAHPSELPRRLPQPVLVSATWVSVVGGVAAGAPWGLQVAGASVFPRGPCRRGPPCAQPITCVLCLPHVLRCRFPRFWGPFPLFPPGPPAAGRCLWVAPSPTPLSPRPAAPSTADRWPVPGGCVQAAPLCRAVPSTGFLVLPPVLHGSRRLSSWGWGVPAAGRPRVLTRQPPSLRFPPSETTQHSAALAARAGPGSGRGLALGGAGASLPTLEPGVSVPSLSPGACFAVAGS